MSKERELTLNITMPITFWEKFRDQISGLEEKHPSDKIIRGIREMLIQAKEPFIKSIVIEL